MRCQSESILTCDYYGNKKLIQIFAWIALVAFAGLILVTAVPFTVSAESDYTKQKNELKEKINESKEKKNAAQIDKKAIDNEITALQGDIDTLNSQINVSNELIAKKTAEYDEAKAKSEEQSKAYQGRVKIMVEKGASTYLEVLLSSDSLTDFLNRLEVMKQVAEYDSELLDNLKVIEGEIEEIKVALEEENKTLNDSKAKLASQKSVLDAKQAESDRYLKELEKDIKSYEKKLAEAEAAETAARRAASGLASSSTKYVGGEFGWPANSSYTITSYYGGRMHPTLNVYKTHTGIDIGASYGTNVLAANAGKVIVAQWNNAYGNYIVIDHGGGYTTLYAHNSALNVSVGQQVSRGQVIAKVGSTGFSTGPHLHFEIMINGATVNPLPYLQK